MFLKSILISLLLLDFCSGANAQQNESPKLVVGIVIDQMCYEYLYRYKEKFSEGGFNLMMNEGYNCRNTQYNYIPTYTGPGHASIYTGTTPSNHGIVGNDWFDRTTNSNVNCVDDSTVNTVGSESGYGKYSPKNLKTNTVTDLLKMTYPDAKVISMSIKNRGAILPGGHLSDGSYWYDFQTGNFITSSFFKEELPAWVEKFNKRDFVEHSLKQTWNTLYDIKTYTESGPDNSKYEHTLPGKSTPTFPYDLNDMTNGVANYELFVYTPYSNTFLTDFAIDAIDEEKLGSDDQTDVLCISYSTPDIVGHAFGPNSIEIEDLYLRLDKDIERLIKELEARVGKHEFTIMLTADHAVVPVPQYLIDNDLPGGYFFLADHMNDLRSECIDKYGKDVILAEDNLNIYLDYSLLDSLELDRGEVSDFLAKEILKWNNVKRSFTYDQLYNSSAEDKWLSMTRNGYHHAESGDVLFILEPGYLPKHSDSESARKGTSHGSAYSYDTHVPLLWYGKNVPIGEKFDLVEIVDIAATLTHILNVANPTTLTGKPITELLSK